MSITAYPRLGADELRNIEEGTYLIIKFPEDVYWEQAEGRVSHITKYDGGNTVLHITGTQGHPTELITPEDARKGLRYDGAAHGSNNLKVAEVLEG